MRIKVYFPDQICNCDKSGQNIKMIPSKTPASVKKNYPRVQMLQRITILVCANASGEHKLPLMCVGKSTKLRTFKNIALLAVHVYYENQRSAPMDFQKILKNLFSNKILEQKASLLICNGHYIY